MGSKKSGRKSKEIAQARARSGESNRSSEHDEEKKREFSSAPTSSKEGVFKFVSHKTALLGHLRDKEEVDAWYDCHDRLDGANDTLASIGKKYKSATNSEQTVDKFRQLAHRIYQHELTLVSGDDDRWMESTISKGTLKDRIAASSVSVAALPVHRLAALDGLLRMAGASASTATSEGAGGRPNSRVAIMAMAALADLFVSNLLPTNRKLVKFEHRPLCLYDGAFDFAGEDKNSKGGKKSHFRSLSPRVLLLWYYEDQLKQKYNAFVAHCLSRMISDQSLELVQRISCIRTAATLLKSVPEGEVTLLNLIVNKLGDPHRKIAAAVSHQLRNVLEEHELMRLTIAREVQQLTHRPNLSPRALYNCIIFLNQLRLDDDDDGSDLPEMLVNTYFKLFEVAINKTDVSSKGGKQKSKKSTKDQTAKQQKSSDEEKSAATSTGDASTENASMKGRLLSALLTGINRAYPYVRSNYFDTDGLQHLDALYRIIHTSPPAACTQGLMLLYQLTAASNETQTRKPTNPDDNDTIKRNADRFYRALYAKLLDTSMLQSRQVAMYFNVVYKAMKHDTSPERVVAFAKRLLHATLHAPSSSPVLIASLYLLSETVAHQPFLAKSMKTALTKEFDPQKREPLAAFGDSKNDGVAEDKETKIRKKKKRQRTGSLWELTLLNCHYHPSVQKFAEAFGEEESIQYTGDPLKDFTLARFLDKMAIRNPKMLKKKDQMGNEEGEHADDAMEERERRSARNGGAKGVESAAMDDDDDIFRRFFAEKERRAKLKKEASSDTTGNADFKDDGEEEKLESQLTEQLMMDAAGGAPVDIDDHDEEDSSKWDDSSGFADGEEVPFDGYVEDDDDFDVYPSDLAWDGEPEDSDDGDDDDEDVLAMALHDEDEDNNLDDGNDEEQETSCDDDDPEATADSEDGDDHDDDDGGKFVRMDDDDGAGAGGDDDDVDDDDDDDDDLTSAVFPDEDLVKGMFSEGFADANEYEDLILRAGKERTKRRGDADFNLLSFRSSKRKKRPKKV